MVESKGFELLLNLNKEASLGIGYGLIPDLICSSTIWTLLQVVLFQWPDLAPYKLKRVPYLDMRNRMVSFIHGVLILAMSLHYLLLNEYSCGSQTNQSEYTILIISSGYFMYDFLAMAWFKLLDFDMTVHHLLCISGMVWTLFLGKGSNYIIMGLVIAEVSNPAMHMRIMLKHIGLRYSRAYEIAEFCYFVMFFIGRMVLGHPIVYATCTCD